MSEKGRTIQKLQRKRRRKKRKPPNKGVHDYASLIHVALVINTYINIVTACPRGNTISRIVPREQLKALYQILTPSPMSPRTGHEGPEGE
jgi:hypothetical protein